MNRGTQANPFELLLVEDNPGDADLVQEALGDAKLPHYRMAVVSNGEEAMAYLRREGPYVAALMPDLVQLDLNLPRKDGREVLADLKGDPELTHIPVIVLTSSEAERDLMNTYRLHANCFISKPVDLAHYFQVVQAVEAFWLTVAKLPPRQSFQPVAAASP